MMDAVNLHVQARLAAGAHDTPMYVGIRLDDGRSPDGVLYDDRRSLFRHHPFTKNLMAVRVTPESMGFREALTVLQMNRMAYKRDVVFREEEVVTPQLSELMLPFIPRTLKGFPQ